MLLRTVASLAALAACSTTPPAPSPTPTPVPTQAASLSGVALFSAIGSIGVRPEPLPPDYDAEYVVAVVDIDNPGDPITGVAITAIELRDKAGTSRAHMRRISEAGTFAAGALPSLDSAGSWAVYTDSPIPAFTGTLAHGHTKLRIRAWLDVSPAGAESIRVTLGNADQRVVIDGGLTGAFPS